MVSRKNKTKCKSKLIKGYKKNSTRKYKKTNALIKRRSKKRTKKLRGGSSSPDAAAKNAAATRLQHSIRRRQAQREEAQKNIQKDTSLREARLSDIANLSPEEQLQRKQRINNYKMPNYLQRNGISTHPNFSKYFNPEHGVRYMQHALGRYAHAGMNAIPGLLGHVHNFAQNFGASINSPYEYGSTNYNNNISALHGMMTNPRSLHIEKLIVNYLNMLLHIKEQQAMGQGMMGPGMMGQGMMGPGMMGPGMMGPGMMGQGMMGPGMEPGMMEPGMMESGMM